MKSTTNRGFTRPLAGLTAVAIVLLGAAGVSSTAFADATNTRNVTQQELESIGEAAGAGAIAGPANSLNIVAVPQINVQAVAGDEETEANTTQTASNTLNVNQTAASASGDATAEEGSTAVSGAALARNLVVGYQLNVQVVAGLGCDVDQTASNEANIDQTAAAASGDATGTNGGNASSGTASASNVTLVRQRNIQIYYCLSDGTVIQAGTNAGDVDQTSGAASGAADADAGSASTGNAASDSDYRLNQSNRQTGGTWSTGP